MNDGVGPQSVEADLRARGRAQVRGRQYGKIWGKGVTNTNPGSAESSHGSIWREFNSSRLHSI